MDHSGSKIFPSVRILPRVDWKHAFTCVSFSLLIWLFASEQDARNSCVDAVSSSLPPFPHLRERAKFVVLFNTSKKKFN